MSNPYLIEGPALISFSGGRTSGYMLWHILDAYDGKLPDDVHVCFANTGKEREETLRFVHDCSTHWGVRVRWTQWVPPPPRRKKGEPERVLITDNACRFSEVGYNSASRNGEPFAALIRRKQYLPNSQMRYCTIELKIRVMIAFMRAQGFKRWTNAVGLRADEMHRVFKAMARAEDGKEPYNIVLPMASRAAQVTERMVRQWWADQPFDLQLKPYEGNCDLCFLKGRSKRAELIRQFPKMADWWSDQEKAAKRSMKLHGDRTARFQADESVEQLVRAVASQPMFDLGGDDDEFDAECGLWCAGEAA